LTINSACTETTIFDGGLLFQSFLHFGKVCFVLLRLLRKGIKHKNAAKPLRHQDTQSIEKQVCFFAKLRAFEPSRQEKDLSERTQDLKLKVPRSFTFYIFLFYILHFFDLRFKIYWTLIVAHKADF